MKFILIANMSATSTQRVARLFVIRFYAKDGFRCFQLFASFRDSFCEISFSNILGRVRLC